MVKIKKWNKKYENTKKNNDLKGSVHMNSLKIQELQKQLQANMKNSILLAEKNTKRNSEGKVVVSADDEWRRDN